MEITPQEQREIKEVSPSTQQTFCILYWIRANGPRAEKKVLRRINSNGTPVSTKKYSEVFFYEDVAHAMPHARWLLKNGYDMKMHKCNRRGVDKFWLV